MQQCAEAWLVSLEYELPSDPAVAYSGEEPIIGCSHLVCGNCGADVRHVDRRSTKTNNPPGDSDIQVLYQSVDPDSPLLDGSPKYNEARAYFCKCELVGVDSGARWVETIDQPWTCAGHEARAHDAIAEAQQATAALIAAAPRSAGPVKIQVASSRPFATASELRDALLASYPDAAHFGNKPLVRKNRDDTAPAWQWVIDLIAQRTDWWPALGIAIQHAVKDGGDLARRALVDILANFRSSFALLPWTAPLADEWPDVKSDGSHTNWGDPEYTFAAIIRDQKKFLATMTSDLSEAFLTGYAKGGKDLDAPLTTEADLRGLLDKTARAGQFPDGDNGPWSWWGFQRLFRGELLDRQMLAVVSTFDRADDVNVRALLDWFFEERDLWRFVPLLERWVASHPPWWTAPADTKPAGWKYDIRSAHWPNITDLGSVVVEALRRARRQVATPPILDLPILYGSAVS